MERDNQHSNSKWTITLAVLSSANATTGAYIIALFLVSVYPLAYALLPPLKPSSVVKAFKETVKATITYHSEHESLLGGTSANIVRVDGLQKEAVMLKLKHVKALQGLSLMSVPSWVRYANDGWNIWVKARVYQREIDALRGEFKILVLQAKTRAPATGGSLDGQGVDDASLANRSEGPDSIV